MSLPAALPLPPVVRPAVLPRPLQLAIGASVGLHVLVLMAQHDLLPPLPDIPPHRIEVVLKAAPPHSPPPPPALLPQPAPVLAAPPKAPQPSRTVTPTPPVLAQRSVPATLSVPAPAPAAPQPVAPAPAPAPAAVAAPVAAPVAVVRSETVAAPAADEPPDPTLLERYGRKLSSLLAGQQQYPRLAAMRGWEGEVQVRVTIARKGNVVATQVVHSSGFELLDQNAVQLVTNAGPLPRPPEALANREIQIVVPVHYKLDKPS